MKKSDFFFNLDIAFFDPLFQRFWLLCRDYERGKYNVNEFHFWQGRIFKKLIAEYQLFKWDEAELDFICREMEANNSMLDPFKFTENPFAFIVHPQNCYFLSQ